MQQGLHVITLGVDDLERALVFYRDGLGLKTEGIIATDLVDARTGAKGALDVFKLEGGPMLALYPRTELAKDAEIAAAMAQSGQFSLGQLVASRDEVDKVDRVRAIGLPLLARGKAFAEPSDTAAMSIARAWPWIAAAPISGIVFLAIFGPGFQIGKTEVPMKTMVVEEWHRSH